MGFFIIIAAVGVLGTLLCLFDAVERALSARVTERAHRIHRERIEADLAERYPSLLQREVYDYESERAL